MQGQEAKGCVTDTQTKRILRVAEENKAVAIDNLTLLCQQGEHLEKAQASVEKINANLDVAEWLQRGAESFAGTLYNYFSAPPCEVKDVPQTSCDETGWILVDNAKEEGDKYNAAPREQNELDKQLEIINDLDEIAKVTSHLKILSLQAQREVRKQTDAIASLDDQTAMSKERLERINKRIAK